MKINALTATLERLEIPSAPVLNRVTVVGGGFSLSSSSKLECVDDATAHVEVIASDLQAFLEPTLPQFVHVKSLGFANDRIEIRTTAKMIFEISVLIVVHLVIDSSGSLAVVVDEVSPGGPVEGKVRQEIEGRNPLLNPSEIFPGAQLQEVRIDDDAIRLEVKLPAGTILNS